MPPRVAIIGAGPAGLVAAKAMLDAGLAPTVFERANQVGGLWNPDSCWDSLRTNLSRYTCCFSDYPWPPGSPLFPSARDMQAYLTRYATLHLPPDTAHLSLSSKVHSLSPSPEKSGKWVLQFSTPTTLESSEFDHVVVASGFFSVPHMPHVPGLAEFPGTVIHSAQYRSPEPFAGRHVAVVGGSLSAAEVAADLAPHAEQVTHVSPRAFWVVPRVIPLDPTKAAPTFLPLDLALYRRSRRRSPEEVLFRDECSNRAVNNHFRAICGEQPAAPATSDELAMPSILAVSDAYAALARDGRITVRRGRVGRIENGSTLVLDDVGASEIPDVNAVIMCTGLRPALPFLSDDTLAQMGFDPEDLFCPLLLHRGTFHPDLPGVAFVGMYRGPLFAVMELQAKWAARVFSGSLRGPSEEEQLAGIAREREVRAQVPRPQFPHGDYVGLADALAGEVGAMRSAEWRAAHDVVVPGHFGVGEDADAEVREVEEACGRFERGELVSRVVFRALEGVWKMSRKVQSRLPSSPSGNVIGRAVFARNMGASEPEYMYREEGEFIMEKSRTRVWREYVYAYNAVEDRVDTYFVVENARGGFFHTLQFLPLERLSSAGASDEERGQGARWCATGRHPCGRDMYDVSYLFEFCGVELKEFEVSYSVKGPEKDYVSTARYVR